MAELSASAETLKTLRAALESLRTDFRTLKETQAFDCRCGRARDESLRQSTSVHMRNLYDQLSYDISQVEAKLQKYVEADGRAKIETTTQLGS